MKQNSIIIIGGGVVGCAIAYEFAKKGHRAVTVLERNPTIPGLNQSSTNEGTIHSGIYYPQDIMPLKAKLCVQGNALLYKFLAEYSVPFSKVGKLIIATTPQEEAYLDFFLQVGKENGVPGLKKISGQEAKQKEPNLGNVIAALHVPSAGVAHPNAVVKKIKELAQNLGVTFLTNAEVTGMARHDAGLLSVSARTPQGIKSLTAATVINSAGLYSDEIARLADPDSVYRIDPARGEFFQYDKSARKDIRMKGMHVYQPPYCYTVKDGKMEILQLPPTELRARLKKGDVFITAGVHLSPTYDETGDTYSLGNTVTISPLKTVGLGKEDYVTKLRSAKEYIERVHYFFPNLKATDLKPDHTGIMCPLTDYRDYVIERDKKLPNLINLIGMESPAWTSCLAIAKYVQEEVY